jgi:signal-transduction protein with cAMP-binding, CBS, and nucleotidyltransferase domain
MRVQDVMTRNVKTVSAAATADEAWSLMRMKRIHHLVVLEGREIAGVVSARIWVGRMPPPCGTPGWSASS